MCLGMITVGLDGSGGLAGGLLAKLLLFVCHIAENGNIACCN